MKKYLLGLLAFMFVSAITLSATSCSKSEQDIQSRHPEE